MATRKIHVFRDEAAIKQAPISAAVLGKSFVTTNISTVTIDDKENLDPVTGLPLSTLLLKLTDSDGKPALSKPPMKYIATTIVTTVISPVSDPSGATTSSPSKSKAEFLHQMKKSRVALGTKVAPGVATSASNSHRTSTSPRPGRLGYISSSVKSKSSAMNRPSGSPTASSKAKGSSAAVKAKRTKKLIIARHAAAVASVAVADSGLKSGDVDGDDIVMQDVQLKPHDTGNDRDEAACVQRIVNQRCRDLTVRPLANVSEAYGASSSDDDRY
ncbi:hypothetical protein BS47DRAFT_1359443 [Hydnum rufescens UP504]|uniref:Uncharacterized protein n=1 Tax=Hydnum rufescens UP504 TaxID=1448309 RepID=A0A9P6DXP0_9AGAM|nr:hypothetical protein BS47DRAFT_1359443 [Hydnum rufescens UP504]